MVDIGSQGSDIIFQVRQLSVHFCANFSKMIHAYFLFSLQHKDHHSHFYCFLFFATTALSCFPSTTTIVLPTLLPPPPPNYFHFFLHVSIVVLLLISSFSLSNRKWWWYCKKSTTWRSWGKQLSEDVLSIIFILYLLVAWYLFYGTTSDWLPIILVCSRSAGRQRRLAAWYKVSSELRLWENPLGDSTAPFFMLCVGKKSLSR